MRISTYQMMMIMMATCTGIPVVVVRQAIIISRVIIIFPLPRLLIIATTDEVHQTRLVPKTTRHRT